jgi:hypothetical protein
MKILLFGEYSGLFNNLKDGLIRLGHQVFLASNGDYFKNYPSDFRWDIKYKLGKFNQILEIANFYTHKELFIGFDIVLLISPEQFTGYSLPNKIIYDFLIKHNKKIYLSGAGISAMLFDYWFNRENEKYHSYMAGYFEGLKNPRKCRYYNNKSLVNWEMDLFSKINGYIPIWYEYAQPFRSLPNFIKTIPIPINLNKFIYKPNIVKDRIVFLHGLSRPCKGGAYIVGAFDRLREKYKKEADFLCAGGLPFNEYVKLIDRVNVVLDDANSYSLGMNALFSMAKGKIVMGGAESIANKELNYRYNPAYNLNPDVDQIMHCIEHVIENKSEIEECGLKSRKFVEEHHDYIKVAQQYVDIWEKACSH